MAPPPMYLLNRAERARIARKITVQSDGCWTWKGPMTPNGYGKWRVGPGKPERAVHRIMWEDANNTPVPEGQQLDHLCRNRRCCNPSHLEVVTPSENTRRQDHANRKKQECPRGHSYTEENTRIDAKGRRICRACDRERARQR